MSVNLDRHRVLCIGDRFITAESFADAVAREFGPGAATVRYQTHWPDEPFRAVDGVREAAGDPAEIVGRCGDVTAIVTHLGPITAAVFDAAPALEVVGITRGGPVNVDLAAASAHGVPVIYLPGRNLGAVSEFVIGLMIALCRNVGVSSRELAAGRWDARYFRNDLTGPELRTATVGLGAVGARVAELLRGFGTRVLAFDPYADVDVAVRAGAELVSLEQVLTESDIVSVHARLTDDTRAMFGATAFAAMKPGARFVNTARGELVDQSALRDSLDRGHLAGAALDVFDPEPPAPDDPLLARADVIVTPHLAGSSRQVASESVHRVVAEVAGYLADGELQHCANPGFSAARSPSAGPAASSPDVGAG